MGDDLARDPALVNDAPAGHCPAGFDPARVKWHVPTILRWIDENRSAAYTPGGDLVGTVLRHAADMIEQKADAIKAVRHVIDYGHPQPLGADQCEHGRYRWEDCTGCYDEWLHKALEYGTDAIPGSKEDHGEIGPAA